MPGTRYIQGIMMNLSVHTKSGFYTFSSIQEVMGKASDFRSGDRLAGAAAADGAERMAAKRVLAGLTVHDITENPAVSYEKDSVTRIIMDDLDQAAYASIKDKTIGELREWLLSTVVSGNEMLTAGRGMTSEVIAAVSKLMDNMDLITAGAKMHVEATCNTTIGGREVLASRLQPNHPVDSPAGITASVLEGLSYGVGDAVLGVNPAIDSPEDTANIWKALGELRGRLEIPTQTCVLSHVTTQMKAFESGARADLCFQSIAGTEEALSSFGVTPNMLSEAEDMFRHGTAKGPNVMYFETGQGSELSSGANFGWDQQTMECRCYGLARHYHPFLVNTVVGFMGPEYLYDAHQLLRAGLEDVFCGHLHGLPMGCDVCYTNHMPTDQNDIENLAVLLSAAGCHYFMGLPQGDDCMLMYQSTGYHDIAALRSTLGKKPIPEFNAWLEKHGILQDGQPGPEFGNPAIFGGETSVMQKSTPARVGIGHAGTRYTTAAALDFWEDQAAAADSVQKEVEEDTVKKLGILEVSTLCHDKYEMLTRPDLGRLFSEETKQKISESCLHNADVQIYFGDGLCSPSIAANVPDLFPAIKAALEDEGYTVGTPFFVRYCRVNTARTIGPLLGAHLTCVLIGERPGLLTNESMSAYMALNARPDMSESDYRVVSNISRVGLPPVEAAAEISDMMLEMLSHE